MVMMAGVRLDPPFLPELIHLIHAVQPRLLLSTPLSRTRERGEFIQLIDYRGGQGNGEEEEKPTLRGIS